MAAADPNFTPPGQGGNTESSQTLQTFWQTVQDEIKDMNMNDFKQQELPLARIKKIMKLDEDVKMISAEAPVLFAKAAEIFVNELSLRAWIHTEDNKRRTLQRNDIAMAISKFDQFDFLIDIVPRDELKPAKREDGVQRASMMPDQVQYYFQLAQQHQANLQQQQTQQQQTQQQQTQQQQTPVTQAQAVPQATQQAQAQQIQLQVNSAGQVIQQPVQVQIPGAGTVQVAQAQTGDQQPQQQIQQPQIIQVQTQQPQQQQQQPQQQQQQQQQQTTQVYHQIVTPSGEVQNIPIQLTPAQMQALQLQVQGKQAGQPVIIQTTQAEQQQQQQQQQATQFAQVEQQPLFQIQQVGGQQVYIQQATEGEVTEDVGS